MTVKRELEKKGIMKDDFVDRQKAESAREYIFRSKNQEAKINEKGKEKHN